MHPDIQRAQTLTGSTFHLLVSLVRYRTIALALIIGYRGGRNMPCTRGSANDDCRSLVSQAAALSLLNTRFSRLQSSSSTSAVTGCRPAAADATSTRLAHSSTLSITFMLPWPTLFAAWRAAMVMGAECVTVSRLSSFDLACQCAGFWSVSVQVSSAGRYMSSGTSEVCGACSTQVLHASTCLEKVLHLEMIRLYKVERLIRRPTNVFCTRHDEL